MRGLLRRGIRGLYGLGLRGPDADERVDWEIAHHLEERADELEAEGLSRAEALREARRQFGDVSAVRRAMRSSERAAARRRRVRSWLEIIVQDVRYGVRGLVRNAGFSAGFVATLGLGIGAMVGVFAIVDALLLRPLPYADSGELVEVRVQEAGTGNALSYLPVEVVREWVARDVAFEGMLPHQRSSALYTGGAEPEDVTAHRVGPTFEEVLGVYPALGRGLLPEDARPGGAKVALVSHAFWRTALGGDAGIVGGQVLLNDEPHTVVGVMPRGFKFPEYATTEFWVPLPLEGDVRGGRVELLARVGDQALERAAAASTVLAAALFEGDPKMASAEVVLTSMEATRGGSAQLRRSVWVLFGAVALILAIAGANGSNLLLLRGARRERELAIRFSVGASRGRVGRQLLTESLLLALLSGLAAVVIAFLVVRGLQGALPYTLAFFLPHALAIESRALSFALVTAMAAGLLLGLFPAIASTRTRRGARRDALSPYAASTPARSRLRRLLVVGEVAVTVVLLAGAGLLLNSFLRLTAVDVGVRTGNLAFLQVPVSDRAQPDSAQRASFLPRLEERIRAMPGVVAATATGSLPSSGIFVGTALQAEGRPPTGSDPDFLPMAEVSAEFFEVTGARLLAGRGFRADETPGANIAIVDEDLARHLWPEGEAVGRRFRVEEGGPWLTVVGVVADLQLVDRDDGRGDFEILYPFEKASARHGYVTVAFRTAGDPRRLFPAVRAAVHEIAPNQPVREVVMAEAAYADAIALPRFLALIVGAIAAFALALAGVGLFAVLGYEVAQRNREIGVRMAIGASAAGVRRSVLREGLALAAAGSVLGVAGAMAATRVLGNLLYDVRPTDPATFAAVLAVTLATAAAASYLPARRATRVDPAEVLRAE